MINDFCLSQKYIRIWKSLSIIICRRAKQGCSGRHAFNNSREKTLARPTCTWGYNTIKDKIGWNQLVQYNDQS